MNRFIQRVLLALLAFSMVAPASAQSDIIARGLAIQAKTAAQTPKLSKYPAIATRIAAGQRARIGLIGDSLFTGWGSNGVGGGAGTGPGTPPTALRSRSMPALLASALTSAGIPARADAVFANGITTNNTIAEAVSYNPQLTAAGAWVTSGSQLGPGGRLFNNPSDTAAFTFAPLVAADSFDIYYPTASGNGTITVTDASGTLATINTAAATGFTKTTVTRAAASTLPISIQRNGTGGSVFISAIIPFDSTNPMVEIWNMGYAGSKVSDWQLATSPWSPFNAIVTYAPDMYFVALGANDANASVSAGTYQTNLQALVTKALTACPVALIKEHKATGGSYQIPAGYLTAIDAITASSSLYPVIDFNGGVTLPTQKYFDSIHLTMPGYRDEDNAVVAAFRP